MNVLLTGKPGVGKTTVIEALVRHFAHQVGGFMTGEIRERGTRKGFSVAAIEGESAIMAHVECRSPIRVGKYGVDVPAFERIALPAVHGALRGKRIVVIDEIGKMELASRKFCEAVREALDSDRIVIATVMQRPHPFADEIKARPDVELIEITMQSREGLANRIRGIIARQIG